MQTWVMVGKMIITWKNLYKPIDTVKQTAGVVNPRSNDVGKQDGSVLLPLKAKGKEDAFVARPPPLPPAKKAKSNEDDDKVAAAAALKNDEAIHFKHVSAEEGNVKIKVT